MDTVATQIRDDEMREIILERIAHRLRDEYNEQVGELTFPAITARLAFKGDAYLNELRLALERLERGEYGTCIFCKSAIDQEVLRTNPTAHFCDRCTRILRRRTTGLAV